jgi:hypothetical protein
VDEEPGLFPPRGGSGEMINVLDFNICTSPCDCGWNIKLGSEDKEALKEIKLILKKYGFKDMTNHAEKITSNPLLLLDFNENEKDSKN